MKTIWTTEQTAFLKANYATMKTAELLAVLTDKTNDQVRWKGKELGIKKEVTRSKADMKWLLNLDDPETCYWWGFITADGCINHRQLILSIHERDKDHLSLFCKRAGTNLRFITRENHDWHPGPYTMARAVLEDRFTLPKLKEMLKIKPQKTYNPLDVLPFCTAERLCYYMAGLIDGDGYIAVRNEDNICSIHIKVHPSWTEAFNQLSEAMLRLYGIQSHVRLVKGGWVVLSIQKMRHVVGLYDLIEGKVPCMARKWDKLSDVRTHCRQSTDGRLAAGPKTVVETGADLGERGLEEELPVTEDLL